MRRSNRSAAKWLGRIVLGLGLAALPAVVIPKASGARLRTSASTPRFAGSVSISGGAIATGLSNPRGLAAQISIGNAPMARMSNSRGLTLTLGVAPPIASEQTTVIAAPRNNATDWRRYR